MSFKSCGAIDLGRYQECRTRFWPDEEVQLTLTCLENNAMILPYLLFISATIGGALIQVASPLDNLARDVTRVESIRHIKNVQRQISHLTQLGEWQRLWPYGRHPTRLSEHPGRRNPRN